MRVRTATLDDKPEIIRIAKMSPYTKGVTNPMFMNDDSFTRKEVAVATVTKSTKIMGGGRMKYERIVGFVVVRNLVRKPYTSLYYVGVDEAVRSRGVGSHLVRWALVQSPHEHIRLICEKTNTKAHRFYEREGYLCTGEGANKAGEPYFIFEKVRAWDEETR